MKRVLVERLPEPEKPVQINIAEAKHLTQVLRLNDGDQVELLDGRGLAVRAQLRVRGKAEVWAELDQAASQAESSELRSLAENEVVPLRLELAVLKGDAMEWAIEKAVELGVRNLVPLLTAHCVVQMERKGPSAFQDRWQRIADQSLKQCGRLLRMQVEEPIRLQDHLARFPAQSLSPRLWTREHDRARNKSLSEWLQENGSLVESASILIGPEGGWSQIEQELLSRETVPVSLGPLVLRAETAAVYSSSLLAAHFRQRKA